MKYLWGCHMLTLYLSGGCGAGSGIRPDAVSGDVSICSDMRCAVWCSGGCSDRLPPPGAAPPPCSGVLQWVVSAPSGDGPGQVFDGVSVGQVGQVELGHLAASSLRGSDSLAWRLLLGEVVGRWGKTGSDFKMLPKWTVWGYQILYKNRNVKDLKPAKCKISSPALAFFMQTRPFP